MVLKQTSKTLTPRLCSSLEAQLPGMLFVTIFKWFPLTRGPFKTGQGNRNSSLGLNIG